MSFDLKIYDADQVAILAFGVAISKGAAPVRYEEALAAGAQWKAEQILAACKESASHTRYMNKMASLDRIVSALQDKLKDADTYVPDYSAQHRKDVLAALVAEAHASPVRPATMLAPVSIAETESWGPWDKPDGLLMDERDEYATPSRPYIPEPAPWYPPLSAEENRERMRKVVYPRPGGFPEQYAAVMWQVSAATGTTGLRERPAAWPRHEIEAPRGAAA